MSTRTVDLLDSAIGNIKNARDHLRHDRDVLPSDLSGVIGTLRELAWTIDTLTADLTAAYGHQRCLGHDNGLDPAAAVQLIVGRLDHVRGLLDGIDDCLGHAHNTAAKLHTR